MKKCIAFILAIGFVIMQLPVSYAQNDTITVLQSGTEVTLSGQLDITLKKEIISCTVTDDTGKYYYIDFLNSENGIFSFHMRFDSNMPTQELTATLSSEYMNNPITYSFLYKGSSELGTLLETLNSAASVQMYGEILMTKFNNEITNMEYLNLDMGKLSGLKEPYDNIYAYLQNHGPYTADNFSIMESYYLRSVELETINQADAAGVKEAILTKGKELGVVTENSVTEKLIAEHMVSEYSNLIYEKMTAINIADEMSLKNAYDTSAALTTIEHPRNGRYDTAFVVENCYETLGLSQEMNRFNKLSDAKQIAVLTAITGKSYTMETLKTAFSEFISEQESKKENSTSGGIHTNTGSKPNIQTIVPNVKETTPSKEQYSFQDIEEVPWAIEAIEKFKDKGIIDGKAPKIFDPHANITREEFVKMIVLVGGMEIKDGEVIFADVPPDNWCRQYIKTACDMGLLYGIGENQFGMGLPITRQDISVIVYRMIDDLSADMTANKADFKDVDSIAEYAKEAVNFLSAKKIINGTPEGKFEPINYATRAEATVILYRTINFMNGNLSFEGGKDGKEASEKEQLLNGLGFLDLKYKGRTDFTRGEFMEIAVTLFGYPMQKIDKFSDVDANYPYYEAIGTAAVHGLIADDTKYFYPDAKMTWDEALRIFVTGMGYAPVVESGNGSYVNIASQLRIMPDTELKSGISYDKLVNVVYNLLRADILETAYYGKLDNKYEHGGELLEAVHNIYSVRGYITETEVSGLYGPSKIGKNEIKIKTAKGELTATMHNAAEYLGQKAEVYIKYLEDDEKEVVYIRCIDDNTTVIQGEDVDTFDGKYLRYFDDDRTKTINLSDDTAIVYNGVAITSGEEFTDGWYKPENGTITYTKGEMGIGDILIVTSYACIVFSACTEKDDTITLHDRYGGKSYTCDKEQIIFYDQSGNEIMPSALSEYDVISVCAPKAMNDLVKVRAYVSNNGITGTITSMTLEEKEVVLEAETFRLTNNLASYINDGKAPTFRPGQSGKFYIDYFGKLAAFDTKTENAGDNIVYLINVMVDDSLDECTFIKVLTADNKIKIYKTKRKVKIDDKTITYDEFYNRFAPGGEVEQQLLLLNLDEDDAVASVYTAQEKGGVGRLVKTYTPKNDSETLAYRGMAYGLGGKMVIGISATKVFVVPNQKTLAEATNDDYVATTRDYFVDGLNYRVQSYTVSEENVLEDAVVVYVDAGTDNIKITDGSTLGLVDEVFRGLNEDEEAVDVITMMYNGNLQTFYVVDGVDVSDIHSGDAVQIKLNPDNEIQKIRKVFDYETRTVLMGNTYGSFLDGLHLMYGPCINIKDTAIEQESVYSNGLTDVEKFLIQGNCYVYDSSLRESRVRIGSYTEIQPQRLAGNDATIILSRRNGGTLREYIIYK